MTKYTAMLLLAALAAGGLLWQRHTINVLADTAEQQARRLGEVTVVAAGLAKNLETMRQGRAADNLVVKQAAEQSDRMTARARTLERQLREALGDEADFDRVLSRGVTDALCLRWRAASGRSGEDNPGNAAGGADAGTGDSAAGQCVHWAGMTVRDAVEWVGLLLDHAGLERLDKAALREWAARMNMKKQNLNHGE